MKRMMFFMMLMASLVVLTCCSAEDPLSDFYNDPQEEWNQSGSLVPGNNGSGSSATTGALATFNVNVDQTTAEPTSAASEYFPEDEDALENNDFKTEVSIDLSNPVAKSESGVEVTVKGGHVTANHGSAKGICYVLSGTTTNGSFTVVGDKKYEVKLRTESDTEEATLTISAMSYVKACLGKENLEEDERNAMMALYEYYVRAKEYIGA